MLTRAGRIKCDDCGRFVNFEDLANFEAQHILVLPDSDRSTETYESTCKRCFKKETAT